MRPNNHQQMFGVPASTLTILSLTALCGLLPTAAYAQSDLFITSDRTIAGGNPINGNYGKITVGADALNTAFPNINASIIGGSSTDAVIAANRSFVTISGGTFGRESNAGTAYTALSVVQGSTVNLTGGSFRSFVSVGSFFGNDITTSTFNMSGGAVPYIYNNTGGVVNITGGSILGGVGFPKGVVGNYGSGTVNITGGMMNIAGNVGYLDAAVTNFGGTATADTLFASNGTVNMTGGTVGAVRVGSSFYPGFVTISGGLLSAAGGVTIGGGGGEATFLGSGLTVTQTGTGSYFDDNNYQNFITAQYTITGNLTDASALNTVVSGGQTYTNDSLTATFSGPTLAPDLYVSTNQTVSGIYNYVTVGQDEFGNPYSPKATIADGNDAVAITTSSDSVTEITGGIIHDSLYATEQSKVTITGGEIDGAIFSDRSSAVTMSGGLFYGFGVFLSDQSTFTLQGSGVMADGSVSQYYDANYDTNYASAGEFHLTGTLTDGNAFDQVIIAGGATGDSTQQTLTAPVAAANKYVTQNDTVNTLQNRVYIGTNEDGSLNTSPTATFGEGANTASVFAYNNSTVNVTGGTINGTIYARNLNISGGTVNNISQSFTNMTPQDTITVSGGSINYVTPRNRMLVTGGEINTLDTYAGAMVTVTGGSVTRILAFGSSGARGDLSIINGTVDTIIGYGGAINILGGNIGSAYLYNLWRSPFTLYGMNLALTNALVGTYQGTNGVWWDVTGILHSGQSINTRYFEANGSLSGPTNFTMIASAPEPGSLLFLLLGGTMILVKRRRNSISLLD